MSAAQEAKARRLVTNGLVRKVGSTSQESPGWGADVAATDHYEIQPGPGTKQLRRVSVTTWLDPVGRVKDAQYRCDCQAADGRVAGSDLCSHTMAVHLARRDIMPEALSRPQEADPVTEPRTGFRHAPARTLDCPTRSPVSSRTGPHGDGCECRPAQPKEVK